MQNNATGETLRAPFSREVILLDQTDFLAGKRTEILRGTEVYKADPLKYNDNRTSEMCTHPIEDGTPIADHKIIQPREFTLTVALPPLYGGAVLRTLNRYFTNSDKIIVQCATGVYRNMILTDLPVAITPNDLERPKYDLSFKEILIAMPTSEVQAGVVNNNRPEDKDTVKAKAVPKEATNTDAKMRKTSESQSKKTTLRANATEDEKKVFWDKRKISVIKRYRDPIRKQFALDDERIAHREKVLKAYGVKPPYGVKECNEEINRLEKEISDLEKKIAQDNAQEK